MAPLRCSTRSYKGKEIEQEAAKKAPPTSRKKDVKMKHSTSKAAPAPTKPKAKSRRAVVLNASSSEASEHGVECWIYRSHFEHIKKEIMVKLSIVDGSQNMSAGGIDYLKFYFTEICKEARNFKNSPPVEIVIFGNSSFVKRWTPAQMRSFRVQKSGSFKMLSKRELDDLRKARGSSARLSHSRFVIRLALKGVERAGRSDAGVWGLLSVFEP
ncbi:hypothetical protein BDZ45DRAFT_751627 [Acephala macrosclerotiorum]|nr:hypothetical protein BDZ45DRAFT_751627 [Acephala macrosclerotiorum]